MEVDQIDFLGVDQIELLDLHRMEFRDQIGFLEVPQQEKIN